MNVTQEAALVLCEKLGGCAGTGHERHKLLCAYLGHAQALADKGLLRSETVIELKNSGNHAGLFATREGAMAEAQIKLDEYHEMYAEMEPEEFHDTDPLTALILDWKVERIGFHGTLAEPDDPLGWETEVARYSENYGYFSLHEREVGQ